MKQVFLNLFLNGVQAMPSGGTLSVGVSIQGERLVVEVSDTGCGVEQEALGKIFEPFFSTKQRGTGLGLSIVRGIIEAHKGTIRARSSVGKGTTFTISLPIGVSETPQADKDAD
jgi:signal transduction histidine kinase